MKSKPYFIIDFDSTFTSVEAFDELCELCYPDSEEKLKVLDHIKAITDLGMEGKLTITESLERRLVLLKAHKQHLGKLTDVLKTKVSASFNRNRQFLQDHREQIFIVSNGFIEFIEPVVMAYGIKRTHIFANSFEYDEQGNITGFDRNNVLSGKMGKVIQVKSLNLSGDVIAIGDGYTDYEMKECGVANVFYAFTENVSRESVISKSSNIAETLDHIIADLNLVTTNGFSTAVSGGNSI